MVAFQVEEFEGVIRTAKFTGKNNHETRIPNQYKPFITWDGEGYTDADGVHHYNLFGCNRGYYVSGNSLNHDECFELLLKVADENDAIHVIFAGTYDLVMMIHKLDKKVCQRIMKGKATYVGQYRVQFYRNKWLSIRDKAGRRIVLYDVFTFFAKSFVKACVEYLGNDETLEEIANVKTQRSTFNISDLYDKVIPYWRLELKYLERLCEELRSRLLGAGIRMSQWHGPGAIATAVLRKEHIRNHIGNPPPMITELGRHAYYGGRFEQFKLGHYVGPVYQYDINSAYPARIAELPSWEGVEWRVHKHVAGEPFNKYGLYQIRFASRERYFGTYPLPWRSETGRIYFPRLVGAPSWYWGIECNNLFLHSNEYEVLECWIPSISDDRPFAFVKEMYAERQVMKQRGDPAQLAVKLALNSLYGKLAQSKGAVKNRDGTWKIPSFHQLLWAGWITAGTRAQLYEAMAQYPSAVVGVETDAIFTTQKLDLPISNRLGEWSEQRYDGISFIQSGVYFSDHGGEWKLKSRGFEGGNQLHSQWLGVLGRSPMRKDSISFNVNRFGTVPGLSNWGRWYNYERSTLFVPHTSKRVHIVNICPECKQHRSLAKGLHPLVVPQFLIPSGNISSAPHGLPWAKDDLHSWEAVWDEADYDTFHVSLF